MIECINRTEEMREKLRLEGKVISLPENPNYLIIIEKLNKQLLEDKRRYLVKSARSEQRASETILTYSIN